MQFRLLLVEFACDVFFTDVLMELTTKLDGDRKTWFRLLLKRNQAFYNTLLLIDLGSVFNVF